MGGRNPAFFYAPSHIKYRYCQKVSRLFHNFCRNETGKTGQNKMKFSKISSNKKPIETLKFQWVFVDTGRDDRIRTCGLCVPNATLYQAEPHLDMSIYYAWCLKNDNSYYNTQSEKINRIFNIFFFILWYISKAFYFLR